MKNKDIKELSVRLNGKEIGLLYEHNGKMHFKYNKNVNKALSLSLPVREEVYTERYCKAYFGGLLPEDMQIRKALAVKYKISYQNEFALLAAIGHDCAGAVTFYSGDEPGNDETYLPLKGDFISDEELEKQIRELPVKPYLGRRLSLAGVQEKTPVMLMGRIFL